MGWIKTSRFTWNHSDLENVTIHHCGHPTALRPYYVQTGTGHLTAYDFWPVFKPWKETVKREECQDSVIGAWSNLRPLQHMVENLFLDKGNGNDSAL